MLNLLFSGSAVGISQSASDTLLSASLAESAVHLAVVQTGLLEHGLHDLSGTIDLFHEALGRGDATTANQFLKIIAGSVGKIPDQVWGNVTARVSGGWKADKRFAPGPLPFVPNTTSPSLYAMSDARFQPARRSEPAEEQGFFEGLRDRVVQKGVNAIVRDLLDGKDLAPILWKRLSLSLREKVLEKLLEEGLQEPLHCKKILSNLPMHAREREFVLKKLRSLSFKPSSNQTERLVAVDLLCDWLKGERNAKKFPSDLFLVGQYIAWRQEENGIREVGDPLLLFATVKDRYKADFSDPVHLAILNHIIEHVLPGVPEKEAQSIISHMAYAYHDFFIKGLRSEENGFPEETRKWDRALEDLRALFEKIPDSLLAIAIHWLTAQFISFAGICVGSSKAEHFNLNAPVRFADFILKFLERIPENKRPALLVKILLERTDRQTLLHASMGRMLALHYLIERALPLVPAVEARTHLAYAIFYANLNVEVDPRYGESYFYNAPFRTDIWVLGQQIVWEYPREKLLLMWRRLAEKANSPVEVKNLMRLMEQKPFASAIPMSDIISVMETRLKAKQGMPDQLDFQFYETFFRKKPAFREHLDSPLSGQISPTLKMMSHFDHYGIDFNFLRRCLTRSDPIAYLNAKWAKALEESRQSGYKNTNAIFQLLLLMDDVQENHQEKIDFHLLQEAVQVLVSTEESLRQEKKPPLFSQERKVQWVKDILGTMILWKLIPSVEAFEFIPSLMSWLTPAIRNGLAQQKGTVGDIFRFYSSGLPCTPDFYNQWASAPDREIYIQHVTERQRHFREGGALSLRPTEEELALAYADMDQPEHLSLGEFSESMREAGPSPPLFLKETFQFLVRSRDVAADIHAVVDKGLLEKGWKQIPAFNGPAEWVSYLRSIFRECKKHGLNPVKPLLVQLLEGMNPEKTGFENFTEVITEKNANAVAMKLLELLAGESGAPLRERVQVQKLITGLVLSVAWQRPEAAALRREAGQFKQAISSEKLFEILRGLQTFYNDTTSEVLKPLGVLKSKEIEKYRAHLQKQREKVVMAKEAEMQTVTVTPWGSQTAIYFGHIARDCNHESIAQEAMYKEKNFQVHRLVSQGRVVGLVYLKRGKVNGKKILAVALQPRGFWKADRGEFLKEILKPLIEVAKKNGFDKLVFSGHGHALHEYGQISNDLDLLEKIRQMHLNEWNTHRDPAWSRPQDLEGHVMYGNEFLVVWSKP
ncbi:MAG: hypothetical protein Q7T03_01890 [Deltaproteobacteria bacterium]|nr:hypothetical protein [Deltaproteobacteria bacterium]